jgi:hypothetical protein
VVWAGDAYAVVWQDTAARIGRDGAILTAPHAIGIGPLSSNTAAASNGTNIVVASGLRVLVLDLETNVVAEHRIARSEMSEGGRMSVASNGVGYLVVRGERQQSTASSFAQVESALLDGHGTPLETTRSVGSGFEPVVASNGTDYLVVARKITKGSTAHPLAARFVSGDLATVRADEDLPYGLELYRASVVRAAGRYAVVSVRYPHELRANPIGNGGLPENSWTTLHNAETINGGEPFATTNGSDLLVVWATGSSGSSEDATLRAQLFDPRHFFAKSAPAILARTPKNQGLRRSPSTVPIISPSGRSGEAFGPRASAMACRSTAVASS